MKINKSKNKHKKGNIVHLTAKNLWETQQNLGLEVQGFVKGGILYHSA
jgi:hypothetical protein